MTHDQGREYATWCLSMRDTIRNIGWEGIPSFWVSEVFSTIKDWAWIDHSSGESTTHRIRKTQTSFWVQSSVSCSDGRRVIHRLRHLSWWDTRRDRRTPRSSLYDRNTGTSRTCLSSDSSTSTLHGIYRGNDLIKIDRSLVRQYIILSTSFF